MSWLKQLRQPSVVILGIATVLLCLGSPNRLLHHYLGALLGIAPLLTILWSLSFWQQVLASFAVWFVFCAFVFIPDIASVKVLDAREIVGGFVVAPLVPLFYVVATVSSLRWTQRLSAWIRPVGMAMVWTAWDAALGFVWFPIPFHWGSLLFDWPVGIQIADLTGIWGVTFVAVLLNATLAAVVQQGWIFSQIWRVSAVGIAVVLLTVGYGSVRLPYYQSLDAPQYKVGAVQQVGWLDADWLNPTDPQKVWDYRAARYQDLHSLSQKGLQAGAQLIVWPEGSLRARLMGNPLQPYILNPLRGLLPTGGGLIIGAAEPDPRTSNLPDPVMRLNNSALLFDDQLQNTDRFGKQWLFPYFESQRFVPSEDGYRPLRGGSVLGELGVMVCLESVLPAPSRNLVLRGAQSLVVISDDSWFGNSNWPELHRNLSIFRSIETRRSSVFVNNTGGNLIVDPSGIVQASGAYFQKDVVTGSVYLRDEITLATWAGDWFGGLTILGTVGLLAWGWTQRRKPITLD